MMERNAAELNGCFFGGVSFQEVQEAVYIEDVVCADSNDELRS